MSIMIFTRVEGETIYHPRTRTVVVVDLNVLHSILFFVILAGAGFGTVHAEDHGGHGGGDMMDGLQTMGIVNALKTGDVVMDMIIAMSIPIILRMVFSSLRDFAPINTVCNWIISYLHRPKKMYQRTILHRSTRSSYGSSYDIDNDTKNQVLIKAIQLYLHHIDTIKISNADLRLTCLQKNLGMSRYSYYDEYDDDDNNNDDNEDQPSKKSLAGALSKYKVIKKPPVNEWLSVGKFRSDGKISGSTGSPAPTVAADMSHLNKDETTPLVTTHSSSGMLLHDVELKLVEDEEKNENNSSAMVSVRIDLQSEGEYSADAFVATAYDWFMSELRKLDDDSRYLYELVNSTGGGGSGGRGGDDDDHDSSGQAYKRYKLSDEKTFESLFFKEKTMLLKLIDHFVNKTGKYAIKGYPHKLGLLLHGPPGTGKTSLIKALAHQTGRSIVNVPLARIGTNSELMSVFFDKTYRIDGDNSGMPVKLGYKDVIFVMEDVDAASKVVRRRDGKRTASVSQTFNHVDIDIPTPKTPWRMLIESNESDCQDLVKDLMEKSERLKDAAVSGDTITSIAKQLSRIPGLGLVGCDTTTKNDSSGSDDAFIKNLASESVEQVNQLMDEISTVDRFTASNARIIKSLLDAGAEVDKELEDLLLGIKKEQPNVIPKPTKLFRDVSYTRYADDSISIEEKPTAEAILSALMDTMKPMNDDSNGIKSNKKGRGGMEDGDNIRGGGGDASGLGGGGSDSDNNNNNNNAVQGPATAAATAAAEGGGLFGTGATSPWAKSGKDDLNLTGLLNVLDGVVDTPGRIVIMTTNHPEMLDPALIRPGRIDKKMVLSYMDSDDVMNMLEHYFEVKLSYEQKERIEIAILGDNITGRPALNMTPAQIEQLAAENDEIDDMIHALEMKGTPFVATPATFVTAATATTNGHGGGGGGGSGGVGVVGSLFNSNGSSTSAAANSITSTSSNRQPSTSQIRFGL